MTKLLKILNKLLVSLSLFTVAVPVLSEQIRIEIAFGQTPYDYTSVFKRFSDFTGIIIATADQQSYDLKAQLINRRKNKKLPDAFISPVDYINLPEIELTALDQTWFNDDLSTSSLALVTKGDVVNAIPLAVGNHLLLYYNKKLVSEPANTWSEIMNQKARLPEDKQIIAWAFNGMYLFIPFLSAFDALPIQNERLTLDTPGMQQTLRFVWDMERKGIVDKACLANCYGEQFATGNIAYVIDGIWAYKNFLFNLGDNLGVTTLPYIGNNRMQPYFSAHVLAIVEQKQNAEKKKALKQLALYLQSEEVQQELWDKSRALPSNQKVMSTLMAANAPRTNAIIKQLTYAVPIPNSPYMPVVWEALSKGYNRYGADLLTAKEASVLMQHLAERTIARLEEE